MSYEQAHVYCATCRRQSIFLRPTVNQVPHLLLSVLSVGLWLPVWLAIALTRPGWKCAFCGGRGLPSRAPEPPTSYRAAPRPAAMLPPSTSFGAPRVPPTLTICLIFATLTAVVLVTAARLATPSRSADREQADAAARPAEGHSGEEYEAGPKPVNSVWDGAVLEVDRELRRQVNDPDSVKYIDWFEPRLVTLGGSLTAWAVRVTYSAKNSFGVFVIETRNAIVRRGVVAGFLTDEELEAMVAYRPPAARYRAGPSGAAPAPAASGASQTAGTGARFGARKPGTAAEGADRPGSGDTIASEASARAGEPCPEGSPPASAVSSVPATPTGPSVGRLMREVERELALYEDAERRRRKACDLEQHGVFVDWRQYSYEQLERMQSGASAATSRER